MNTAKASQDRAVDRYISEINQIPLLSREAEAELAKKYIASPTDAVEKQLITANLRFVVKVAHEYKGYGYRLLDLVQEGNIGLMMAVRKFDPQKGYRLISYAVWWVRAYIQNYIMRSWSLVKLGTTQAQRKLFFRLRGAREQALRVAEETGNTDGLSDASIALSLNVRASEVSEMHGRMAARDFSLDAELADGAKQTHIDRVTESALCGTVANDAFEEAATTEERGLLHDQVGRAMTKLSEKEQYIVRHRLMCNEPLTLQQVGDFFHISRERARQIEGNTIRKMRGALGRGGIFRAGTPSALHATG